MHNPYLKCPQNPCECTELLLACLKLENERNRKIVDEVKGRLDGAYNAVLDNVALTSHLVPAVTTDGDWEARFDAQWDYLGVPDGYGGSIPLTKDIKDFIRTELTRAREEARSAAVGFLEEKINEYISNQEDYDCPSGAELMEMLEEARKET